MIFNRLIGVVNAHPEYFAELPLHDIFKHITVNWAKPISVHFTADCQFPVSIRHEIEEIFWVD